MKSFVVFVLVLLGLACLAVNVQASETEREVRSYVSDMQYVDRVESPSASLVEMRSAGESASESDSESESLRPPVIVSHSFDMEGEEPAPVEADAHAFLEAESESEAEAEAEAVNTEVEREMAGEMQAAALALLETEMDNTDAVLIQLSAEGEQESETEGEGESESESDAEADVEDEDSSNMLAELQSELDKHAEPAKQTLLPPKMVEQERMDKAAEQHDKAAEAKDKKEAAEDAAKAAAARARDAIAARLDAAAVALHKAKVANAKATAVKATTTKKTAAPAQSVVVLPSDYSAEHRELLKLNAASTQAINGGFSEMSKLISAKDETIRNLIANVTYLSQSVHKLAHQVDLQRSYINLQNKKMKLALLRNARLQQHAEDSAATVKVIQAQLKASEARLALQQKHTKELEAYLKAHEDKIQLPNIPETVKVIGLEPKKKPAPKKVTAAVKKTAPTNTHLKPVPGTQTWAYSDETLPTHTFRGQSILGSTTRVPVNVRPFIPRQLRPLVFRPPPYIPTIVVEAPDDGQ